MFGGAGPGGIPRGAVLVAALLALALMSCVTVDKSAVTAAVAGFHERFNAADWTAIYDGADPSFKDATTREAFVRAMTALHSRVGQFQKAEERSFGVQAQAGGNAGTYARVTYATVFSQETATELFAWRVDEKRVLLVSYDAR
jgi:hypothetical protein